MQSYLIKLIDGTLMREYGFLSFAKDMGKNVDKSVSRNVSNKFSQQRLDHTLKSVKNAFKTASKGPIKKPAEGSVDLIDNKIADKTTKTAYQSNLDTT